MNCPNCDSKVNQGEAFCRLCGTKIPQSQNNSIFQNAAINNNQVAMNNQIYNANAEIPNSSQESYLKPNIQSQNETMENVINDDDLIDAYIGKNANELKNGGFSCCTFFIGMVYVFYRKMWLVGAIWFVVNIISNMFLPLISSLITFATGIIMSFQFKKLYLKHVEEEVEKIKTENVGKTKEELMKICIQKGGTTITPVIVVIVIIVFLYAVIFSSIVEGSSKNSSNDAIGKFNISISTILDTNSY